MDQPKKEEQMFLSQWLHIYKVKLIRKTGNDLSYQKSARNVWTVGLVSDAEGANDGAEVNVLLVWIDAELELVVSARLNDGRITCVQLSRVQIVGVFLILK